MFYFKSFLENKNLLEKKWRRNAKKFRKALPLIVSNPIERSIVPSLLLLLRKIVIFMACSCCLFFLCKLLWTRISFLLPLALKSLNSTLFGLRGRLNYPHYYFQLLLSLSLFALFCSCWTIDTLKLLLISSISSIYALCCARENLIEVYESKKRIVMVWVGMKLALAFMMLIFDNRIFLFSFFCNFLPCEKNISLFFVA